MKKIAKNLILVCLFLGVLLIDGCKKDPVIPTLTTNDVSNISLTSVTSGGAITKDGGKAVTAYGVCWSTSIKPDILGSHTTDGKGAASFTSSITGLTPNTVYYIRAYATNSVGTAYGNEVSFTTTPIVQPTLTTTAATSISLTSAVTGGNITSDGGGNVTAKGVCWSTTTGPTITDSKTSDGTGTGSFVSNLSGLLSATTYYIRAYATNSAGTAYGDELTFTTTTIVVPTLTTATITSITLSSAITGGNITTDGGGAITSKGTCWALTANPTINNSKTTDGTGPGNFISNLTGLQPGVTYYIRAYATNSAGTAYGNQLTFVTTSVTIPSLTTSAVTSITLNSAISGGNITSDGGGTVTVRGACWATTANPTTGNSFIADGTGIGTFVSNLSGLLPATTYHVRAYATNSAGTAYGNDITFITSPIGLPTLTTTSVTSITLTTAVSGGNITSNGGGAITVSGICWSTTTGPTTSSPKTTNGTLTGSFVSNLTGLTPATTYYVRAYATNSTGTSYGNEVSFTTSFVMVPTLTTVSITAISYTTATSGGNIAADGGAPVTAKGVCWATTSNPTITNSLTSDGTGIGIFASSITGLTPGTTYHVRAYAINSAGPAYGNDLTFTATAPLPPTVTTTAVSSIGTTTATSGGNVVADGFAAVTARGVCWSLNSNPTLTDFKTTNGTGTGSFVSNLTSLLPGTTYHIRAYATNSVSTAFGSDVQFTTSSTLAPVLSTSTVTSITLTTATSGGTITTDNGTITAKGICYSTTANPTLSDNVVSSGTGSASFVSNLTGLTNGTNYYVRAYATNNAGTGYGDQQTFTTVHQTGTVTDVEGNVYNTVLIGSQWWMAQNLKTIHYKTGNTPADLIPNVTDNTAWSLLTTPAYSWYFNDPSTYKNIAGAIYNWYAVNTGNLCPTGWHAPSDDEYKTMEMFLGMTQVQADAALDRGTDQGTQMKSTS